MAASALVLLVLARLLAPTTATLAGLLFAVHPIHVEAVANGVGIAEPIAAVLALSATLLHLRAGPAYGFGRVLAVSVLYGLAVLSKGGAVVLPALLVVLDATTQGMRPRDLGGYVRQRGLVLTCMAGVLAARAWVLGGVVAASHPLGAAVLQDIPRIWTIASAWPHYVRLLFVPWDLSYDYSPEVIPVAYGWTTAGILGAVLVLGALLSAWAAERRGSASRSSPDAPGRLSMAVLWIALALLPVANLLYLAPVLVAERTLYLPSVGVVAIVSWGVMMLARERKRLAGVAAIVLILGWTARTVQRVPTWKDGDTVSATLFEEHPRWGRAWYDLARRLAREGRNAEASRAFGVAIGMLDSESRPAIGVGTFLADRGRAPSARFFLVRPVAARRVRPLSAPLPRSPPTG